MDTASSRVEARTYVAADASAPAYWMMGVLWRVLVTGIQTGGSFCLFDQHA